MITGNDESWRTMLVLVGPVIKSICRRAGLDPDEIDDVAQTFVLKLLENNAIRLRRLRVSGKEPFFKWVRIVVNRIVMDGFRDRYIRIGLEQTAGESIWAERIRRSRVLDDVERKVLIDQALSTLKPVDKAIFWLDFFGLKDSEIAEKTSLEKSIVQKRLSRLRERMQRVIGNDV
jgi:RNA polymerase sigma factor (sigma-70 family)